MYYFSNKVKERPSLQLPTTLSVSVNLLFMFVTVRCQRLHFAGFYGIRW
jgi:hypothetical protein